MNEIIHILTSEERLAQDYKERGTHISVLVAERESIRDNEIWPLLRDGVSLGFGDLMMVPEYQNRVDFDWERMVADGVITQKQANDYITVKVTPVLNFRKRQEATEIAYEKYIARHRELYDDYRAECKEAKDKQKNEIIL